MLRFFILSRQLALSPTRGKTFTLYIQMQILLSLMMIIVTVTAMSDSESVIYESQSSFSFLPLQKQTSLMKEIVQAFPYKMLTAVSVFNHCSCTMILSMLWQKISDRR